jgi:hypothetical protein
MVKNMNIIGANYKPDSLVAAVSSVDIADAAANGLQANLKGKSHVYIVGDEHNSTEVAAIIGAAIKKPNLPWVEFSDEDVVNAMERNGATHDVAVNYAETGAVIKTGQMYEDYKFSKSVIRGKVTLADFAKDFSKAF